MMLLNGFHYITLEECLGQNGVASTKPPQVDLRGFLSYLSYFTARPNRAIFHFLRWNVSRATRVRLLGVREQGA